MALGRVSVLPAVSLLMVIRVALSSSWPASPGAVVHLPTSKSPLNEMCRLVIRHSRPPVLTSRIWSDLSVLAASMSRRTLFARFRGLWFLLFGWPRGFGTDGLFPSSLFLQSIFQKSLGLVFLRRFWSLLPVWIRHYLPTHIHCQSSSFPLSGIKRPMIIMMTTKGTIMTSSYRLVSSGRLVIETKTI